MFSDISVNIVYEIIEVSKHSLNMVISNVVVTLGDNGVLVMTLYFIEHVDDYEVEVCDVAAVDD